MWLGFSKNIGGGFRVGVGGRVGGRRRRSSGDSRARRKPTQAELQKQEKEQFISQNYKRAISLGEEYATAKGILVVESDVPKNLDHQVFTPLRNEFEAFFQEYRMVKDGGSLTNKRRETMLNSLHAIEDALDSIENDHPLYEAYQRYKQGKQGSGTLMTIGILCGLIGFLFPPAFIGAIIFLPMGIFTLHSAETIMKTEARSKATEVVSEV